MAWWRLRLPLTALRSMEPEEKSKNERLLKVLGLENHKRLIHWYQIKKRTSSHATKSMVEFWELSTPLCIGSSVVTSTLPWNRVEYATVAASSPVCLQLMAGSDVQVWVRKVCVQQIRAWPRALEHSLYTLMTKIRVFYCIIICDASWYSAVWCMM